MESLHTYDVSSVNKQCNRNWKQPINTNKNRLPAGSLFLYRYQLVWRIIPIIHIGLTTKDKQLRADTT